MQRVLILLLKLVKCRVTLLNQIKKIRKRTESQNKRSKRKLKKLEAQIKELKNKNKELKTKKIQNSATNKITNNFRKITIKN